MTWCKRIQQHVFAHPAHPTHLVGRCPNVYAFAVLPAGGGVSGKLEVVQATVLDSVVRDVGVYHEVLKTNALSPDGRCGFIIVAIV